MTPLPVQLVPSSAPLSGLSEAELGGKAWNLHRLRAAGFDIPDWWVVPSRHFRTALGDRAAAIDAITDGIDFTDRDSVEAAADAIRDIVIRATLPAALCRELAETVVGAAGKPRFAVRSSVPGEDSAANSFAGQMDTVLNVPPSEVEASIREVWASAYSARALHYRHRRELALRAVSPAVIIQRMLPSVAAGVMFTRDPETADRRSIISAAHGLCEGVTSDAVETDTYLCDAGGAIEKRIAEKTLRIISLDDGGVGEAALPRAMCRAPVLDDGQIQALNETGRRAEIYFGAPQDIEWAFDAAGRCWLLQARPIVFAASVAPTGRLQVWDNSNIVESYPGITLPLTFSFARKGYETAFRGYIRGFFPFRRGLIDSLPVFSRMLGLIDGRVYYNLPNWYAVLSLLPHLDGHKAAWNEMVGVAEGEAFEMARLAWFDRLCASVMMGWKLLTARRTASRFLKCFDDAYRRHASRDFSDVDEFALIDTYQAIANDLAGRWRLTLDNDFCTMIWFAGLKRLCARWGPAGRPGLHNDLLRGQRAMESMAPVRSLDRLARLVAERPHYSALFAETDELRIWRRIRSEDSLDALKAAFDDHLAAFGDRSTEELKLDNSSFRERPEALIGLVRQFLGQGTAGEGLTPPAGDEDAKQLLRRHLRNPFKRLILSFIVRRAGTAIANRENMRFARARLFGLARRIFRRMGEAFANRGLIEAAVDIHFLTVDEVFDYVLGMAATQDLAALIALRKAEYARFGECRPADRIRCHGLPYGNTDHTAASGIRETSPAKGNTAEGVGCGSGRAEGRALMVRDPGDTASAEGCILVAHSTDPGWVFLMTAARGIIVEKGSVLSHTAIVGRELGIPTIVGVKDATRRIADGAMVFMDGGTGAVRWNEAPVINAGRTDQAA